MEEEEVELITTGYKVTWLANLFHSFPHLDLTFQLVNSTFNLDGAKYKETLMFWASVPVLWLLLTLLVFLMYFCYRCCRQDSEKRGHIPCLRWTMAIFAVLSCGAVGVGFYGNEDTNKGVRRLTVAVDSALSTINLTKIQMGNLQRSINDTFTRGIVEANGVYNSHPELNPNIVNDMKHYTDQSLHHGVEILRNLNMINRRGGGEDLSEFVLLAKEYEFYRWIGTLLAFSWLLILCLVLLVGIGRSSKCLLLLFCAFGIFSLVLCWISAGIHLGSNVGIADFCVSPHQFVEEVMLHHMDRDIVNYYTRCDIFISNPFRDALQRAQDNVREANVAINKALHTAQKFIAPTELDSSVHNIYAGLNETTTSLMMLTAFVECTNLHEDYMDALEGICGMALPGLSLIILSAVILGITFTFLVLLASRAWRNFGPQQSIIQEVQVVNSGSLGIPLNMADDDNDSVFRGFSSYSRERHANPREQLSQHRRTTPPPAYNSSEYYRQYTDVNPPDDGRSEYGIRESNA